jgi:hypothetical protein
MDFTLGAGWLWPSLPDLVLNKNELICGNTPPKNDISNSIC